MPYVPIFPTGGTYPIKDQSNDIWCRKRMKLTQEAVGKKIPGRSKLQKASSVIVRLSYN
jgi:hypothetical protein